LGEGWGNTVIPFERALMFFDIPMNVPITFILNKLT